MTIAPSTWLSALRQQLEQWVITEASYIRQQQEAINAQAVINEQDAARNQADRDDIRLIQRMLISERRANMDEVRRQRELMAVEAQQLQSDTLFARRREDFLEGERRRTEALFARTQALLKKEEAFAVEIRRQHEAHAAEMRGIQEAHAAEMRGIQEVSNAAMRVIQEASIAIAELRRQQEARDDEAQRRQEWLTMANATANAIAARVALAAAPAQAAPSTPPMTAVPVPAPSRSLVGSGNVSFMASKPKTWGPYLTSDGHDIVKRLRNEYAPGGWTGTEQRASAIIIKALIRSAYKMGGQITADTEYALNTAVQLLRVQIAVAQNPRMKDQFQFEDPYDMAAKEQDRRESKSRDLVSRKRGHSAIKHHNLHSHLHVQGVPAQSHRSFPSGIPLVPSPVRIPVVKKTRTDQ